LNQELLQQLIDYDCDTGVITWSHRPREFFKAEREYKIWNTRYSGKEAIGTAKCNGKVYKRIRIQGKDYLQHRVVFILVHGYAPDEVDHINGDTLDNRKCNLRAVNRQENCKNTKLAKDNKSGIHGVTWETWSQKWLVRIGVDGKGVNLGRFNDFFEACCTRKSAELKYRFHANHGRR